MAGRRCPLVVLALSIAVLTGLVSIPLLMVLGFLLGIGQTLYDTESQVFVPALVSRQEDRLQRANGQLTSGMLLGQQLVGPPLGGVLFTLAPAVPLIGDAGRLPPAQLPSLRFLAGTAEDESTGGPGALGPRYARRSRGCGVSPPCACSR